MVNLIFNVGCGGHFFGSLLLDIEAKPNGNDYYSTLRSHSEYNKSLTLTQNVEGEAEDRIVIYPSTEEGKQFTYKLFVAKKLFDVIPTNVPDIVDNTTKFFARRNEQRYDTITIVDRVKELKSLLDQYGLPLFTRGSITWVLSDKKIENYLKDFKKRYYGNRIPFKSDYPNIESKYKYTYEQLCFDVDIDNTLFKGKEDQIRDYHNRNVELLNKVEELLCQI